MAHWKSKCFKAWFSLSSQVYVNRVLWSYKHHNCCFGLFPQNLTASQETMALGVQYSGPGFPFPQGIGPEHSGM